MKKYKIADAHAHIYPEKIAEKATAAVGEFYGIHMDDLGTAQELILSGEKIGTEKYLVCSVATKADQVSAINRFIARACQTYGQFVGLGAYHQDIQDIDATLEEVKKLGFPGIKLHPDFQQFHIDDPVMIPVYQELVKRDLCVLFHIGDDRYDYSAPERLANVLELVPDLRCIAAHFGGYRRWADGIKILKGANIMYDTSSSLMFLDSMQAAEMIQDTGVSHFMFGTDFPMWTHQEELNRILALGLTEEENQQILYDNFKKFFRLE